jgi:3-hydroxybutyrate dehydrogenase
MGDSQADRADDRRGLLDGRVAVITGANGGLGRAIRAVFEREGATVVGVDIGGAGCLHADLGTDDGNRRAIEAVLEQYGPLDVLVLNAGLQHMAPIDEFAEAEWDRLTDVMLKGPFLAVKHAWPQLIRRPGGRIVFTASTTALVGEAYKAAYVASKHGIAGLMKVAALEGARHGLNVNAVAPGWMWTGMAESQIDDQARLHGRTREEILGEMDDHNPVGRMIEPREVAEVIAFLASDRASGISGTCIPVDLASLA